MALCSLYFLTSQLSLGHRVNLDGRPGPAAKLRGSTPESGLEPLCPSPGAGRGPTEMRYRNSAASVILKGKCPGFELSNRNNKMPVNFVDPEGLLQEILPAGGKAFPLLCLARLLGKGNANRVRVQTRQGSSLAPSAPGGEKLIAQ